MKKLFSSAAEGVRASLASSVLAAPAPGTTSSPRHAAPAEPTSAQGSGDVARSQQYLRLTVEAARKLRWYDQADLAALVRTHTREKRVLQDALTACKQLLLRGGLDESAIDREVAALLQHASAVNESEEGVASVLLASAMAEMDDLRQSKDQLQQQLQQLQQQPTHLAKQEQQQQQHAHDTTGPQTHTPGSLNGALTASAVADGLGARGEAGGDHEGGAVVQKNIDHHAPLTAAEGDTPHALHQALTQLQQLVTDVTPLVTQEHHSSSWVEAAAAALQQGSQLASEITQTLLQAVARAEQLEGSCMEARQQAAVAEEACRAAQADLEALAQERAKEQKRKQGMAQGAEAVRRLQDACIEAQERAVEAARRVQVLEARCVKLEGQVREGQGELATVQGERAELLQQLAQARRQLAESCPPGAPAPTPGPPAEGAPSADQGAQQQGASALEGETSKLQGALTAQAQVMQAMEARLLAVTHEAQAVTAERDDFAAQVAVLRGRLQEGRAERAHLDHLTQMVGELDGAKARLEAELLTMAQMATQLDSRLRETQTRAESAESAAEVATARAKAVEAGARAEFDARMAAVATNRALWPAAARDELSQLHARTSELSQSLAAAQQQLQQQQDNLTEAQHDQERLQQRLQQQVHEAQQQLSVVQGAAAQQTQHLTAMLELAQAEAEGLRAASRRAELERDAALRRAARGASTAAPASTATGGLQRGQVHATAHGGPVLHGPDHKWQVQNTVGGGSLFGVADSLHSQLCAVGSPGSVGVPPGLVIDTSGSSSDGPHTKKTPPLGVPGAASDTTTSTAQGQQLSSCDASSSRGKSTQAPTSPQSAQQQEEPQRLPPHSLHHINGAAEAPHTQQPSLHAQPQLDAIGSEPPHTPQVDVVYLKNVILRFVEAALSGRVAERDALLPAVATLLQATPAEYQVLRKVIRNTGTVQALSALGRWIT